MGDLSRANAIYFNEKFMKRTHLIQSAAALAIGAVLTSVAPSSFAQSTTLAITGQIVPPACTPAFAGGNTFDFGKVTPRADFAQVGEKRTTLTITCTSPSFIAFKVTDNREGTQVTQGELGSAANTIGSWLVPNVVGPGGGIMGWNNQLFGLGKSTKGAKIGAYSMQLGAAKVSGSDSFLGVTNLVTTTGVSLSDWMPLVGGIGDSTYKAIAAMIPGFNGSHGLWVTRSGLGGTIGTTFTGDTGLYVAKGFKYTAVNSMNAGNLGSLMHVVGGGVANATNGTRFTFPITVRAMLNSAGVLGTGTAEKLDGLATFDLVYI